MKKVFTIILMALAITAVFVSCDDPKHEHSFDANKWESDGTSHWHVCTTCGEKLDVADHTLETTKAKEPTCTEKGWDEYVTCNICGYSTYKEKPATGHNYADPIVEDGKAVQKCTACGYKNYDIDNATIVVKNEKSFVEAVNASGVGTVKLGEAIEIKDELKMERSIVIDLNSKKLTITGATITANENIAIEIKNIAEGQDPISIVGPKVLRMSSDAKKCGYYPTFKDAVENAGSYEDAKTVSYDTIYLLTNVGLTDSIIVNKKIGLVLNGKNLTGANKITIVDNGAIFVFSETETEQTDIAFSGTVAKSASSDVTAYCSSIATAISGAENDSTITLLDDVELKENVLIGGTSYLTLDMNEKTITTEKGASISIGEEAVLIVTNVAENQKDFVSSEAKISLTVEETIFYCYCSFDTAMLQATDGMLLTLTDDVTVNNEYTIDESLTIDLNEKTLTVKDSDPFISVSSSDASESCEVTIKNGAVLANRTNKDITKGEHQVIFSVDVGGFIILDDVNVTDNTDYGYIFSACGSSKYSSNNKASYVSKVVIKNGSTITTTGVSAEAIIASKNSYSDNSPILIEVEGSTISATGTGALAVDIGGDKGSVSLNITGSTIKGDACALGVQGNGTADVKNSTIELTQTAKGRLPINAPIAMMSTTGKTKLTLTGVTSKYVEGAADGKIWLSNSITTMPNDDVISVYGSLDSKVYTNSVKGNTSSSSYLK